MISDDGPDFLTVAETAKRLDVHENTVRNWARIGKLPSARIPGTRAHRFDVRDVERLLRQRGEIVSTVAQERQAVGSPELVDASQLGQWANTASRDAQATLPKLIRRLLSYTHGITAISMRAGDGVVMSGWDGEAESTGASFLPAGHLRFEIGTGQQPKTKADKDWKERLNTPNAHELCFVFVTPRRWRDGKAWAEARKAEGIFADVRVLDGEDIEGWLESVPHVHYWISEHLGRAPRHAQTLAQWWRRFSRQTKPNLPGGFFLAGRERAREKLGEFLAGDRDVITVQAKWREDALAFTAAALDSIVSERQTAAAPAIVVAEADPWHRLAESPIPTILIPLFDNPDVGAALDSGHHVVIPVGADAPVRGMKVINLDPPHRELARKSLEETREISFDEAYKLSALARRNMPSFVRALSRDQRRRRPAWASDTGSAAVLAPLVLAGAWSARDGDWQVVSELADADKEVIERLLLHWLQFDDPPFVQPGESQWHVVSREEALMVLRERLTTADITRWLQIAPRVLPEFDPVLELEPAEQMLAGVRGIGRDVSGVLRRGLAEGVAALASLEDAPIAGNTTCEDVAGQVVSTILARAAADDSGRTWQSLSDVLPLLAEAAPAKFLDFVLDDLDTSSPVLRTMFQDDRSQSSWMAGSSPHTGLLWALEVLCWSPEHIGFASLALAKLQAVDPGGQLANRPLASLQSILVFWVRQTSAPLAAKMEAIEAICQQVPEVGWRLVLGLWPSKHATATPPRSPRYRDWRPDTRHVPMAEAVQFITRLVALAISLASAEIGRWKDLVDAIAPLPPDLRTDLLDALEALASSGAATGQVQLELWDALRAEVDRHRQFKDADWAMDEATVDRLERIADLVKPTSGMERFAYLFAWHVDLPEIDRLDFQAREKRLRHLRNEAVRETLATGSIADLEALARRVKVPGQLGWAIGDVAPDSMEPALAAWLESEEPNLRDTALAWLRCKLDDPASGPDWFRRIVSTEAMTSADRRLDLVRSTPSRRDFWDLVVAIDPALADEYWSQCHPHGVSPADTERAVHELLARNQAWVAIDIIASVLHHEDSDASTLKVEDAMRALEAAITSPLSHHNRHSIGYEVGVVLDYLERHEVDETTLARYEFALFSLIQQHRQPRALFRALCSDHRSYVDLVSRVFRGKDEPKRQLDEFEAARAQHAYWVLMHWRGLPGLHESGAIDSAHLKEWVTEARLLFAEGGRADIGDEQIGQVLSHCPAGEDGIWPAEAVREIIEMIGSANIESGIVLGALNNRGATWRGVFDGGGQERDLARRYQAWSRAMATTARRTSRVLRLIAESYERQARQHDADASISGATE